MLTLWGRATSTNVQKVIWACDELGLAYQRIDMGGPFGGNDDPAYRAKNPNGLIPTLEDGDFVLWESNAILRYLAAGDAEHRLLPADLDRRGRANVDRWMDWQLVSLGLTLRTLGDARTSAVRETGERSGPRGGHQECRHEVCDSKRSSGDSPVCRRRSIHAGGHPRRHQRPPLVQSRCAATPHAGPRELVRQDPR